MSTRIYAEEKQARERQLFKTRAFQAEASKIKQHEIAEKSLVSAAYGCCTRSFLSEMVFKCIKMECTF